MVTTSVSTEPKGQIRETGSIRDYECAICGHKQKAAKQTQNVDVKNKVSARMIKAKKTKTKTKTKTKDKKTKNRKRI